MIKECNCFVPWSNITILSHYNTLLCYISWRSLRDHLQISLLVMSEFAIAFLMSSKGIQVNFPNIRIKIWRRPLQWNIFTCNQKKSKKSVGIFLFVKKKKNRQKFGTHKNITWKKAYLISRNVLFLFSEG